MSIEVYEGVLGGSKTYHAVQIALKYLANGGHIYTNIVLVKNMCEKFCKIRYSVEIEFDKQYHFIENDDMAKLHNTVSGGTKESPTLCILDEIHIWYNSRDWAKASPDVLRWLTQTRKINVDIIIITQHINNVDKQWIRLLAGRWRFRDLRKWKMPGLGIRWPLQQFLAQCYDQDGKTLVQTNFEPIDKDIFKCYDSSQVYAGLSYNTGVKSIKLKRVDNKTMKIKLVFVALLCFVVYAVYAKINKRAEVIENNNIAIPEENNKIRIDYIIVEPELKVYDKKTGRLVYVVIEGKRMDMPANYVEPSTGIRIKKNIKKGA